MTESHRLRHGNLHLHLHLDLATLPRPHPRRARPETLAEAMRATLAGAARREKRHRLTVQGVGSQFFSALSR